MKIKYLILLFVVPSLHGFGSKELLTVKFSNGQILPGEKISKKNVDPQYFGHLVKFYKAVTDFRRATSESKVKQAFDDMKTSWNELLKFYKSGSKLKKGEKEVHPYELGKSLNRVVTGIFNALAALKEIPNAKVGLAKTYYCSLIFADIFENLYQISKNFSIDGINSCMGKDSVSIGCLLEAKDKRKLSLLESAEQSGNFLFFILLTNIGSANSTANLENYYKAFIEKSDDELAKSGSALDILFVNKPKYKTNFEKAFDRFKKRTNLGTSGLKSLIGGLKKLLSIN